jgi:hypothetical protein
MGTRLSILEVLSGCLLQARPTLKQLFSTESSIELQPKLQDEEQINRKTKQKKELASRKTALRYLNLST